MPSNIIAPRLFRGLANGTAGVRTASFNGDEHLIVPVVVLIGDSVIWTSNAPCPELVPLAVLASAPGAWNNRPIIPFHPDVSIGSSDGSANYPELLERWAFGAMFNTALRNGALQSESWINLARLAHVGPLAQEVVARVRAGELVEISMGAYVQIAEEDGEANGVAYGGVWVAMKPDHLAMFGDATTGACSVEMGCGAPRMAERGGALVAGTKRVRQTSPRMAEATLRTGGVGALVGAVVAPPVPVPPLTAAALTKARMPVYSGTSTATWARQRWADWLVLYKGDAPPANLTAADTDLRDDIAKHTLLGDPAATDLRNLTLFAVVSPHDGKLYRNALRAVLGGHGSQANILSAARKSAQDVARRLLKSEFGEDATSATSATSAAAQKENPVSTPTPTKSSTRGGIRAFIDRLLGAATPARRDAVTNSDVGFSDQDLRDELNEELLAIEPMYCRVIEVWPDTNTVVYTVYTNAIDYVVIFYRRTFTPNAITGEVAVNDDRVEVQPTMSYEPVPPGGDEAAEGEGTTSDPAMTTGAGGTNAASTSTPCACGGKDHSTMATPQTAAAATPALTAAEKNTLASRVVALAASPFQAGDETALAALSDERLRALETAYAPVAQATQATPGAPASTPATSAAAQATGGNGADPWPAPPRDVASYLAALPPDVAANLSRSLARDEQARTVLAARLVAAQTVYTKEQLAGMSYDELGRIARLVQIDEAPSYAGAGGFVAASGDDDEEAGVVPQSWDVAMEARAARNARAGSN